MRQLDSIGRLFVISLALFNAAGQAATTSGGLDPSSLVGAWEIDSSATILRAVEKSPASEKQQVRQELTLALPKQRYVFVADGTYKVTTTTFSGNVEDAGTWKLSEGKLMLNSSGKGGTRTLELVREEDKLLMADRLVLARPTPNRPAVPTTRSAGPTPRLAKGQANNLDARTSRGGIERTAIAGMRGDKNTETVVSRSDRLTGLVFELNPNGDIGRTRPTSQKQRIPAEALNRKIVTARPGYVLYGIRVDAKERVNALRLVFARLNEDDSVAPDDTYESDWIGTPLNNKAVTLGCDGKRVVGFSASSKDGLLSGISLSLGSNALEDANTPEADAIRAGGPKQVERETVPSPKGPMITMVTDLLATLESVNDAATAKQALEKIGSLKKQHQDTGIGNSDLKSLEPLMQRLQQKLRSIGSALPVEGRVLEAAARDLVISTATPQQRAASANSANRIGSSIKLKQLAVAILLHERKAGTYPATLDDLIKNGSIKPDVLDSPLGNAAGGDFIYIRPIDDSHETVLLYDAAALAAGEGTNVAFLDGSVQWLKMEKLRALNIPRSK